MSDEAPKYCVRVERVPAQMIFVPLVSVSGRVIPCEVAVPEEISYAVYNGHRRITSYATQEAALAAAARWIAEDAVRS